MNVTRFALVAMVACLVGAGCSKNTIKTDVDSQVAEPSVAPENDSQGSQAETVALAVVDTVSVRLTPTKNDSQGSQAETVALAVVDDEWTGTWENIAFGFNQYTLTEDGMDECASLAAFLMENPTAVVCLDCHACQIGTNDFNMALSERRCRTVVQYLLDFGVPKTQISPVAHGEEKPIIGLTEDLESLPLSEQIKALKVNRRAEINIQ